MSDKLPFMNSTGLISKILDKIIEAQTPPRYSQDFQDAKLGYGSGSARAFLPLLRRIGFIGADGTPTQIYKEFRSESLRGQAMAKAIKIGYAPLYTVSEYAHDLDATKLKDAVIQVTGHPKDSSTVKAIVGTFNALKNYADFEAIDGNSSDEAPEEKQISSNLPASPAQAAPISPSRGMNLSYTINLNLPETKDPEVFDAIFTSLKAKLLS